MGSKESFDSRAYWKQRVDRNADISIVGHRSLGLAYNKHIYQRRLDVLADFLASLSRRPEDIRVLDIGCGSGFYANYWSSLGVVDYTGVDISKDTIKALSLTYPNYHFVHADITKENGINAIKKSYDIITVFDVFYHIVDDNHFLVGLQNISRHLNRGGLLLVFDHLIRKDFTLTPHVKFRGRQQYDHILNVAGLRIRERHRLFQIMVPPVFAVRAFDVMLAGLYKSLGFLMTRIDILGRIIGRLAYKFDGFLLKHGSRLPNHELLVIEKS